MYDIYACNRDKTFEGAKPSVRYALSIIYSTGHREQDRSSKETYMKDFSCHRFLGRKVLLRLVAIMTIVPALMLSFSPLISSTAQAHSQHSLIKLASNTSPHTQVSV